jgi:hypothetical protein
MILCAVMLVIGPAQLVASAAASDKPEYISEVKVGMGQTSDEASKELLEEGYTILLKEDGSYADLNENAGSKSALKAGPNQKIVYLGYKTTSDASDAITDLAVMNMEGGYSFQEYEILMDNQMETQIKPFVERFIATLTEYRENLQKPVDSVNYKRADYYRTLLNKLTDDDTDGKPLGDLLINKTKYELGDEAYNALSDEEKKNYCDIVTLLMQGNGQAVLMMETMLAKSADAGEDTWIERFLKGGPDALYHSVKEKNPRMTPSEINAELDKKYYDTARKIADKWSAFAEVLLCYDEAVEDLDEVVESEADPDALIEKLEKLDENSPDVELAEATVDVMSSEAEMIKGSTAAEDVVVKNYLESVEYGDGTLYDFFDRDASEFSDNDAIRALYPIVDALSGGQIAALDFLSIKDMILMAITDENGFDDADIDEASASIYEGVNREIYERGGVALTNDALRAKANANDVEASPVSNLSIVLWSCAAASGVAAALTAVAMTKATQTYQSMVKPVFDTTELEERLVDVMKKITHRERQLARALPYKESTWGKMNVKTAEEYLDAYKGKVEVINDEFQKIQDAEEQFDKAQQSLATKSTVCKYLSIGFTFVMVALTVYSIVQTVRELIAYYDVEFAPIPKYIVDEVDITATNEKGEKVMIQNQTAYYKAVLCNRTAGDSSTEKKNYEILGDRNDLNGDVGRQWLALYSVKYENGTPILADSLKFVNGSAELPDGYTAGIHRFGEKGAFNLTSKYYCYNDPNNGTYVFFKNAASTVKDIAATTGSMFSAGSLAIGAVGGLIVGVVATLLLASFAKKKKEEQPA